jgi:hypothetical protein
MLHVTKKGRMLSIPYGISKGRTTTSLIFYTFSELLLLAYLIAMGLNYPGLSST